MISDFMQAVYRDLVPTGALRAAINFANTAVVQRSGVNGEPCGLAVELAAELADRLSVPRRILEFRGAEPTLESGRAGSWDLAFLAIDLGRREHLDFTKPYVVLESTYLVHDDAPYYSVLDIDRDGVRIAVGQGGFFDSRLSRTLRHAHLLRSPTYEDAVERFLRDRLDALAGLRQPLLALAQENSGLRVIEGRFSAVEQAIAVPKRRPAGVRYLNTFVEQVKYCDRFTDAMRGTFDIVAGVGRSTSLH